MINQQIMVYSVPRTGSTLIWQCLAKIFTQVLKAHRDQIWQSSGGDIWISTRQKGAVLNYSCPCVITERGMMDTFLSQWRTDNVQNEAFMHDWLLSAYGDDTPRKVNYPIKSYKGWADHNDSSKTLDINKFKEVCDAKIEKCYIDGHFKQGWKAIRSVRELAVYYQREAAYLQRVKAEYKGPILTLQYEQFWNDYDYIFNQFEAFFNITISEETKLQIKSATSRDNNITNQTKMQGFKRKDQNHIHGGHIFLSEPGYSNKILGEKNLRRFQTMLTCKFEDIMEIELEE